MATSKIQVISNAAIRCGDDPVSSLMSDRKAVEIGNNLYDTELEALLCDGLWTFARATVQLAREVETPVANFKYSYQQPANKIKLLGLTPRGIHWQYSGEKILANTQGPLYADYILKVGEDKFPPLFAKAFELTLALNMAIPLTGSETIQDKIYLELHGDSQTQGVLSRAQAMHGQEDPNLQPVSSPFTDVRRSGGR